MADRITQRIAVIGGVAAGPSAAAEAKRVDPAAEVVLIEQGPNISYGACEIPYYVAGTIRDLETLIVHTPTEFERKKGVSVRTGTEVVAILPGKSRISLREVSSGRRWDERFDKIILAVGATPKVPQVEGLGAANVFTVRDLHDARHMRLAGERIRAASLPESYSRRVVIVGGGYVGVEMANAFHEAGHPVTILQPGGRVLPDYLEEPLQDRFSSVVTRSVQVRDERLLSVVRDPAGRVQAVETDIGERIACSILIIATGVEPNTRLARDAGIRLGRTGAIHVTAGMRTSSPNVWACGDCIEVTRIPDGRAVYLPLAPTAYRTARVAARNAASRGRGGSESFEGVTPASALHAFGLEVASVGLRLSDAEAAGIGATSVTVEHVSRVGMLPEARPIFVTLVFEQRSGRILGGQLLGEEGAALRANVLVPMIRKRCTLTELAEMDLVYAPPIAPSLDPLYVAARAGLRKQRVR